MAEKPELYLEELPEGRFQEYLDIFNKARKEGMLGKVIPPKTLKKMFAWKKHGTTFFLVKEGSSIIGACGVSQNRILKRRFQIINQFILPEFRGKGYGELMLTAQEGVAIKYGAKKLSAFLYYLDGGQYHRFRKAGYKGGHLPSIGHALKGRFSGKVRKSVPFEKQVNPSKATKFFRNLGKRLRIIK
jgi:GNAT superfamily N-acetyltransferase